MKLKLLLSLSLSLSSTMIACVRSEDDGVAEQSLGETGAAWRKRVLKVCFLDGDGRVDGRFTDVQKAWIRAAISSNFSPSATGISFTGFADCDANGARWDVQVSKIVDPAESNNASFQAVKTKSAVPVGEGLGQGVYESRSDKIVSVRALRPGEGGASLVRLELDAYCGHPKIKVSREICAKGLALHEFGHVAGLPHEHARKEAANDPHCRLGLSVDPAAREASGQSVRNFGLPYDPKSIMNYCFMDAYETGVIRVNSVSLSPLDRQVLRKLYP